MHIMKPSKIVVKCGKFAVLVDLHVLPQGDQNSRTWFSQEHKEEVGALIKDAVEQRVKQFLEDRHSQSKQKKEPSPNSPLCIKGQSLRLAAYFVKRHVNLQCVIRQHRRELRVFPMRCVVCVSLPQNNMPPGGNLNRDVIGQSRSGYFSGPRETLDPLNSSTITKRAALQKIARQANSHLRLEPEHETHSQDQGVPPNQLSTDAVQVVLEEQTTAQDEVMDVSLQSASEGNVIMSNEQAKHDWQAEDCPEQHDRDHVSEYIPQNHDKTGRRRRRTLSSPGGDFDHQEAKRVCLRETFTGTDRSSGPTTAPSQSSTLGVSGAATQASSECMLEEDLLTHGKQTPHLPLCNSTAKHTNQSRLAASLRGLSVKAVSSGSSISSRSAAKEEENPSVPRISRLRRLKKS